MPGGPLPHPAPQLRHQPLVRVVAPARHQPPDRPVPVPVAERRVRAGEGAVRVVDEVGELLEGGAEAPDDVEHILRLLAQRGLK
eukprot:3934183-Rhodomonas_salina.1